VGLSSFFPALSKNFSGKDGSSSPRKNWPLRLFVIVIGVQSVDHISHVHSVYVITFSKLVRCSFSYRYVLCSPI